MTKSTSSRRAGAADRAERLAQRLRDNLGKRKAQARARDKGAAEAAPAPPAAGAPTKRGQS
jgi:hypothetical protein